MTPRDKYVEALNDIARSLFRVPAGETVAWSPNLLPEQVSGELTRLRVENERLRRKVGQLEAEREL